MRPMLIVMRLADMTRVHPNQDNDHVCMRCGHIVGIYPSGQGVLRDEPDTEIVCQVCNPPGGGINILAPGAEYEPGQSVEKKGQ